MRHDGSKSLLDGEKGPESEKVLACFLSCNKPVTDRKEECIHINHKHVQKGDSIL